MKRLFGLLLLNFGLLQNSNAVPPVLNYAGQVTVNGEAFDGAGLFKFALVNADGTTTYWSNDGTSVDGSEPQASVSVPVNGGLYAVLLGNTAQQGMGPIDPSIFAQHTDAKLRIWFSDGLNGFQQLSPDRPFSSVPYAFSAGSATIAAGTINRSMLSGDIWSDLNRTISHNDLSPQIKADINATIGLDRLSSEVISKLEQNATITNGSVSGSKMADGAVTASKISNKTIQKDQISDSILKYLKPEISDQPQASTIYEEGNGTISFSAEGKYLSYQWRKDGMDLVDETNATLNIIDANASKHDGNYSVVVSNDFGSTESRQLTIEVNKRSLTEQLVGYWKFDETSGDIAYDSSGNDNDGALPLGATWIHDLRGRVISLSSSQYMTTEVKYIPASNYQGQTYSAWFKNNNVNWMIFGSNASSGGMIHLLVSGTQNLLKFPSHVYGGHVADMAISKNMAISLGWHHVCLVKIGSKYNLYFDGNIELVDMRRNTSNSNSKFNLGRRWGTGGGFSGIYDDIRIYNRSLSDTEIKALYNLEK